MNKSDDHDTVESAASLALNKGTPPDYTVPAEVPAMKCYLCSYGFPADAKVNWRGHWICSGCFAKEAAGVKVELSASESSETVDYILNPQVFILPEKPSSVSASDILEQAASTIEQRGKDYNSPGGERSMKATVEAFNAIRGHSLSIVDGWAFMEVLKMVRAKHSPHKVDNFLDGAAYAALAGEEALNPSTVESKSVTELASEHPNLAEYIASLEERLNQTNK